MQAGVDKKNFYQEYNKEIGNYNRETAFVSLINIETGNTDYLPEHKIKKFWDNLAEDDRLEMEGWTYQQFFDRIKKSYDYYLRREGSIVAIGGTYPDGLNISLWLLVTDKARKYPLSLIRAVKKGIKKELKIYPEPFDTVLALPDDQSITHHRFIEKVFGMEFSGKYFEMKKVYKIDKQELLECVSQ